MAMCVIAVVGAAPCQCFSLGANETTSPGRISSIGPPFALRPAATGGHDQRLTERMGVPRGASAGLERDARAANTRRWASNRESIRTLPVKYSSCPWRDGCEPLLLISILRSSSLSSLPPFPSSPRSQSLRSQVTWERKYPEGVLPDAQCNWRTREIHPQIRRKLKSGNQEARRRNQERRKRGKSLSGWHVRDN